MYCPKMMVKCIAVRCGFMKYNIVESIPKWNKYVYWYMYFPCTCTCIRDNSL